MANKQYSYRAELVRVVDGDTVRLRLFKDLDMGFYIKQTMSTEMNFRIMGLDTPEVRGPNKAEGLRVKVYVKVLLEKAVELRAVTYKPDKYGRWLIDLYIMDQTMHDGEEFSLADHLIAIKYGVPYDGGKRG